MRIQLPVVGSPPTHSPRMTHFGFLSRLTPQARLAEIEVTSPHAKP